MNYKYALKYVYYKAMILHVYISATNNIRYSFCYQKLLDQDFIVKLIFIISQTACCAVIMLKLMHFLIAQNFTCDDLASERRFIDTFNGGGYTRNSCGLQY